MMKYLTIYFSIVVGFFYSGYANAQAAFVPPGQLTIDGIPVFCSVLPTIISPNIPDVAMNNGQAILLNPMAMGNLPTVLKLYIYAHECGHAAVGANEVGADCWAIRTGRNQGWFPPQAFNFLMEYFRNNPGDITHPSGPQRVVNMMQCYSS